MSHAHRMAQGMLTFCTVLSAQQAKTDSFQYPKCPADFDRDFGFSVILSEQAFERKQWRGSPGHGWIPGHLLVESLSSFTWLHWRLSSCDLCLHLNTFLF